MLEITENVRRVKRFVTSKECRVCLDMYEVFDVSYIVLHRRVLRIMEFLRLRDAK